MKFVTDQQLKNYKLNSFGLPRQWNIDLYILLNGLLKIVTEIL